jgi:hypothetical protein
MKTLLKILGLLASFYLNVVAYLAVGKYKYVEWVDSVAAPLWNSDNIFLIPLSYVVGILFILSMMVLLVWSILNIILLIAFLGCSFDENEYDWDTD